MLYLVAALVFLTIAVLAYVSLVTVFSEERQVSRRLRNLSDWEASQAQQVEPLLQPFGERVVRPIGAGLRKMGRTIAPADYREDIRQRLRLAGNPRGMDAERFIAVKFVGLLSVLMGSGGLSLFIPLSRFTWALLVVPLALVAFLAPDLWLRGRIGARKSAIRRSLPDMLDMLTISVEAGLGFDAAISKLVKNSEGALPQEFARMLQEIQAGVDRSDALRHMSQRTDVSELNTFIMAIIQAEVFGISVAGVLRTQAKEMRLKRRQIAEEQAQKAPVKMVFPLVLCILPSTLIVILGPAIIGIGKALFGT